MQETEIVKRLSQIEKRWPAGLSLFVNNGVLMLIDESDRRRIVWTFDRIPCDGGDLGTTTDDDGYQYLGKGSGAVMGLHVSKSALDAVKGVARFLQGRAVVGDGMMGDVVAALLLATEAGRLADFYKVVSEWMIDSGLMDEDRG